PKDAEKDFREAIAIQMRLVNERPKVSEYREDLAKSHNCLGILLRATSRPSEAENAYRQAIAIQAELEDESPQVFSCQNDLAGTLVNLAQLQLDQKRPLDAQQLLLEAIPRHKLALEALPQNPQYRQFFRENRLTMIKASLQLGDRSAAISAAE